MAPADSLSGHGVVWEPIAFYGEGRRGAPGDHGAGRCSGGTPANRTRSAASTVHCSRQAAVVFILYGRLERPGTHVWQGAREQPVTSSLGAQTVPARRDGGTPAPSLGRRRA